MVFEAIQVGRPELAIGRKPVVELYEGLRPDSVQPSLGVHPYVDEPGVPENSEMLGHGRLADAEPVDELAHRPFAVAQQIEDREAAGLGENLKCGKRGHAAEYSY